MAVTTRQGLWVKGTPLRSPDQLQLVQLLGSECSPGDGWRRDPARFLELRMPGQP